PGPQLETRLPNRESANLPLEGGAPDFRIGRAEPPRGKLRYLNLLQDRFHCIARANPPDIGSSLTRDQYRESPRARTVTRNHMNSVENLDRALAALGRQLRIATISHDYIAVPFIVAQSNLIATVPERLADLLLRQLGLRKFDCP